MSVRTFMFVRFAILDCLTVGRDVYYFESDAFELVLPGGCALRRVKLEVVREHCFYF